MEPLTDQQVMRVRDHVRVNGVEQESLINDLTDHICTDIEERLARGQPFDQALAEAASLFGANGLRQIQLDTFELLNEINDTMKKAAFIIGLLATTLLLSGTIFKLMHWIGANVQVLIGASLLVLAYFPILLRYKLKESPSNERLMHIAGFLGITLTTLGVQFKIFHWPGASFLLISGMAALAFLYVPLYYYARYKVSNNRPVTLSTGLVAMTCLILVFALMQVNHSRSFDRGIASVGESLNELEQVNGSDDPLLVRLKDDPEAQRIRSFSTSTIEYLNKMRAGLVAETEDISLEEAKGMSTYNMKRTSNYDVPTDVIFRQNTNMFYEDSIVQRLGAFRDGILAAYDDSIRPAISASFPYDVAREYPVGGMKQNWAHHWFFQVPMVGVINQIAKLQHDVRQQERQALLYLALRKN